MLRWVGWGFLRVAIAEVEIFVGRNKRKKKRTRINERKKENVTHDLIYTAGGNRVQTLGTDLSPWRTASGPFPRGNMMMVATRQQSFELFGLRCYPSSARRHHSGGARKFDGYRTCGYTRFLLPDNEINE